VACVLLEREGVRVAGVASTGADALRQVEALRPDVVLVEIFLGEERGLASRSAWSKTASPTKRR
jgi:two-component system, NarL family, nitrate/nitrite response regulator NarL